MILYIHSDKEVQIHPDDVPRLKECSIYFRPHPDSEAAKADWYIILGQKICLEEDAMADVLAVIDSGYPDEIRFRYSGIGYNEVYLCWD